MNEIMSVGCLIRVQEGPRKWEDKKKKNQIVKFIQLLGHFSSRRQHLFTRVDRHLMGEKMPYNS